MGSKNKQSIDMLGASTHKCPKCGSDIFWSCTGDKGYAYCSKSAIATRTWKIGELHLLEVCDWEGSCERRLNGKVEIYYYP